VKLYNRTILALTSMLLLAVLVSGCGLPWPFPQRLPDPKLPDAQQVFRPLASGPNAGDLDTLDPALIQFGFDSGLAQLIFPQLVTLDERQQPVDWAAESHEISADGLTYTFHLRKGMTWADGTPIDATTFAYSINRTLDPCTGASPDLVALHLYDLAGAKAFNTSACPAGAVTSSATLIGASIQTPDPLTLRLTLAHPAGYFLAALTWPTSYAVPQALIERYGVAWTHHLTDNGPFGGNLYLLTTWSHTQTSPANHGSLVFERNERFWGQKPLLRRIEYALYYDVGVEWSIFAQGTGDASTIPVTHLAAAQAMHGVTVQRTPTLGISFLRLNWQRAPFDDVRVRQAFSLALDRTTILPAASRPVQQPSIHLVPEGMPGYNPDLTDAARRMGTDALTADLATARTLASAYAAEQCAGAFAKCPAVIYMVLGSGSSSQLELAQGITAQWRQAFPGWAIQAIAWGGSGQLETVSKLQLGWDGWGVDYPDPQDFLSLLWATHASYNQSNVSVPQVDALLAQADGMSDLTTRIPLYQHAEQLLLTQGAAIPLAQTYVTYALRSRVAHWRIAPTNVTPLSIWQTAYLTR
jgi:peptide/nickel transport system substrate-binding protein/oligopeptide transport system substrate-binding protein